VRAGPADRVGDRGYVVQTWLVTEADRVPFDELEPEEVLVRAREAGVFGYELHECRSFPGDALGL
jgi:hypothetical protein